MSNFDIEVSKAELAETKKQYTSLLALYAELKSLSHSKQIFPDIEKRIYEFENNIAQRSALIENYEDLSRLLHGLERDEEGLMDHVRRVRVKFEE